MKDSVTGSVEDSVNFEDDFEIAVLDSVGDSARIQQIVEKKFSLCFSQDSVEGSAEGSVEDSAKSSVEGSGRIQ